MCMCARARVCKYMDVYESVCVAHTHSHDTKAMAASAPMKPTKMKTPIVFGSTSPYGADSLFDRRISFADACGKYALVL